MKNIAHRWRPHAPKDQKPRLGDPRCKCGVQFKPQFVSQVTCFRCATMGARK